MIRALEDFPEQLNSRPESVPLSIVLFASLLKEQIALIRVERDRPFYEYQIKHDNTKLDAYLD